MRRLIASASLVGSLVIASSASAQNPYSHGFSNICTIDYVTMTPQCAPDPLTMQAGITRLSISEGIVGTKDHELGYIILTNPENVAQTAVVEVYVLGEGTFTRRVALPKKDRVTLDLHNDAVFPWNTKRIFTTFVYLERGGSAELKIYAFNPGAPDPLSTVTTDKDGLLAPVGTH